MLRAFCILQTA
ncbi:Protein of unknown function [Pyronema omphalodes CBS 100304]|uniref:Uncharacterized protein n=1 Tax=Pyronema omphalodes (strain CBS 100304) TaxID=1076935 RepID=U4LA66_PYROM|nr:Protein of unknown function [Pyronema omphalodes CBS 100304]